MNVRVRGEAELVLGDEPDAVPRARAFATALVAAEAPDVVRDAQLVVTELVTNALLHGLPPVSLRISRAAGRIRVEVEDAGRTLPLQARGGADSMTGRGLELVAALCSSWGTRPSAAGKVVWAELAEEPPPGARADPFDNVDALIDYWSGDAVREQRYTVRLGAVPTDLLLAAKAHVDNVVRELTLMRAEEVTTGVRLPAPIAALVTAATEDFAEARTEIKRQALAAARRGEPVVDLVLNLPLSAAEAGERYLGALEEADRHARAARLLTLAPPRSHRAFRRWYVQALVAQLRAVSRGEEPPPARPFPQVLADEVDRLGSLEESWQRLQLLQGITAELTDASSAQEVAATVVRHAGGYPGVATSRVYIRTARRTLRSIAWYGAQASLSDDQFEEYPLDSDFPGSVVARTGKPLFMRSLSQIYERFPVLAGLYPGERSLHVVPLNIAGQTIGLLTFTFVAAEVPDDAQLAFVRAIADVLAQAMKRAQANEREEAERERDLNLLGAQLEALADIVAGQPLNAAIADLLVSVEDVSEDGMLGSVLLLSEDGRHLRHCAAPSLPDFYNEAIDGVAIGPAVGSCGTAAHRDEQVIVEDVTTDPLWADYRELAVAAGLRSCWSTPIRGGGGQLLGTFAMYYPRPHRPAPADLALIDMLVRTVGMAIERSRADEERERALAAERAAALTLQQSLLPAVPETVGPVRLDARYRTGDPGVEVGGDWFDAVEVADGTMLIVGDVQGHDLQAAALMGQLRTVARAAASDGRGPAELIAGLHRYLSGLDTELLATVVAVLLDPKAGKARVACAGHPAPLLVDPAGGGWRATDLELDVGPPLGLVGDWSERSVSLPPGSVLLLYTDGLVETRTWPIDHGMGLLRHALTALPRDCDLPRFLDAALDLIPTGSRGDDVAVLAARTPAADRTGPDSARNGY